MVKFETIFCFALVLGVALFSGCATDHSAVMPDCQINGIHMLNARDGWAEAYGPGGYRILKTTDGARDWKDVTPLPFPDNLWSCEFATMKTAWVTIHTNTEPELLMTTNGGSSWARVGASFQYFTEASEVRFVDDHFGVAQVGDGGLGSIYYTFYETGDGGVTWTPLTITPPDSFADSHTVHLSSYNGDKMAFYPRKTFIIAYGESGDFSPNGYVKLSISTDFGKSWREMHFPLPAEERNEYTSPHLPVLFGGHNGILPVVLFTQNDDSRTVRELVFYRTKDGGETWSVSGAVAIGKSGMAGEDCDVISGNDVVVRSGGILNVSHDAGKSWEAIAPNIDLGMEDPKSRRDMVRMDFVNADRGWMIISDYTKFWPYDHFSFYRTTDGGRTWAEVPLRIFK